MRIGYFLSCEEYSPEELVEQAAAAEEAGFDALWISDHFHPWNDEQGQSPFVWSVIGAISQVCSLPVTTAVTCPTVRTHPAIIAQAAATSARMLERAVRPRHRHRRGAERAHPGRPVAVARRTPGDARGGGRADPRAVDRRGRDPAGQALRGGHRTHLHAARPAAADLHVRVRAQGARGRGPDRRRLHLHAGRRRHGRGLQGEVRRQARPGRLQGRLGRHRGRGRRPRPPALGQRRPARRAGPGAALARSTSSRPRSW